MRNDSCTTSAQYSDASSFAMPASTSLRCPASFRRAALTSPAITAIADILQMGRAAKVNLVGVAQMLTARAIGGPEARENFGVRCLARYTANAWKMLVPEAAMPRASRTLGRWQLVVGGHAIEVQVGYLTAAQARTLAVRVPDRA